MSDSLSATSDGGAPKRECERGVYGHRERQKWPVLLRKRRYHAQQYGEDRGSRNKYRE